MLQYMVTGFILQAASCCRVAGNANLIMPLSPARRHWPLAALQLLPYQLEVRPLKATLLLKLNAHDDQPGWLHSWLMKSALQAACSLWTVGNC
jgi:hypothetical protein